MYQWYGTNTVWTMLKNGTVQRTSLDTHLHPWRNQAVPERRTWGLGASLFKDSRITERVTLRFTANFFNVLHMPATAPPFSCPSIVSLRYSAHTPRPLQLTSRPAR
jgi:hypothetical protein